MISHITFFKLQVSGNDCAECEIMLLVKATSEDKKSQSQTVKLSERMITFSKSFVPPSNLRASIDIHLSNISALILSLAHYRSRFNPFTTLLTMTDQLGRCNLRPFPSSMHGTPERPLQVPLAPSHSTFLARRLPAWLCVAQCFHVQQGLSIVDIKAV